MPERAMHRQVMGGSDSECQPGPVEYFWNQPIFRRLISGGPVNSMPCVPAAIRFGKGLDQAGVVRALDRTAIWYSH